MAKPNFTLPNKPAIKSGSILSYNYTDDFTFVPAPLTFNRDSAATRVNEKGLIEDVGYFGPELVQNGDFSEIGPELVTNGDFSNWTNDNPDGWTIIGTENENNYITEYQGKARYVSDGSTLFMYQNILTTGKFYKITADIVVNSGGGMRFQLGASGTHHVFTTTQSIVLYAQQDGTDGNLQIIRQGATDFTLDNVSVKEVGQNWTFGTGWSMGDGKVVGDSVSTQFLTQSFTFVSGKKYRTTCTVTGTDTLNNNNSFRLPYDGDVSNIAYVTKGVDGIYTHEFVSTGSSILYIGYIDSGTFTGSIDNVSVVEVLGDKPRIDYSDSLTEPSLLLEPQSTNLIPYSEDFSNNYWRKDKLTVTPNSIISPTGELNASLIKETSYTSSIPSIDINSPSSLSAGTYTFSFYVKNNNGRYLGISFGSSGERVRTNFDFNTNTFKVLNLSGSTTGTASFTTLGDFYRIFITATFPSATIADTVLMPLATDTYPFFAFQDSDNRSFYLWGAQVEALSYATSYITTFGSTATRLGETANNAGDVNVFNSEEGVLYAEIAALADGTNQRWITIGGGSNANRVSIHFNATNRISCSVRGSFSTVYAADFNIGSQTNNTKAAIKYKDSDYAFFVNGVKVDSQQSGSLSFNASLSELSFDSADDGSPFYGKVKNVQVFNKALTDRELEILTIQ